MSVGTPAAADWYAWHDRYDELVSPVSERLDLVQRELTALLDGSRRRVVSLAAGQSRDLLPILIAAVPRGSVTARVVDLDPRNVEFAEGAAISAGLSEVEFVVGDAGKVDAFVGAVPADVVLLTELLPLLPPDAADRTIAALPQLCAPSATVVWTAGAVPTPELRRWIDGLARAGFDVLSLGEAGGGHVAVCRLVAAPTPLVTGTRLFDPF